MKKKIIMLSVLLIASLTCSACNKAEVLPVAFSLDNEPSFHMASGSSVGTGTGFASKLAVVAKDAKNSEGSDSINSESALLVDATTGEVLFQKNSHKKEFPASTTKILTALVAIENSDVNSSRELGPEVLIDDENMVMCDFREGDTIPFDIILHGALMYSGNDAAAALALFAADSLDDFADMMNERAKEIGATESHFMNPHGLDDPDHYTTAYDLYLIFNEAIKNEYLLETITTKSYSNSFNRSTMYGDYVIATEYSNSNKYISGLKTAPSYITVLGGKAGFTDIALRSYVMLAEANGHQYIFVTMKCENADLMYEDLDYLMSLIPDNSNKSE